MVPWLESQTECQFGAIIPDRGRQGAQTSLVQQAGRSVSTLHLPRLETHPFFVVEEPHQNWQALDLFAFSCTKKLH